MGAVHSIIPGPPPWAAHFCFRRLRTLPPHWIIGSSVQLLQLRQPKPDARKFLSQLRSAYVNILEASLDWTFDDIWQLQEADWLVRHHWVKQWHGLQRIREAHDTQYWASRGARNVPVVYSDRKSRIMNHHRRSMPARISL